MTMMVTIMEVLFQLFFPFSFSCYWPEQWLLFVIDISEEERNITPTED